MKHLLFHISFGPAAVLKILTVIFLYGYLCRFKWKKSNSISALAVELICFCEFSSLHILSSQYLFSAHMSVHVILLLLCGPLLVAGLRDHSGNVAVRKLSVFFRKNFIAAWFAGVAIMWFWHLPTVFNVAMSHQAMDMPAIGYAETLSLIFSGMVFSWPVLGPCESERLEPLRAIVYLFTACITCSLLGLLITFAPAGVFHHYLATNDIYGLNDIITKRWQLTRMEDQQAAGLIMWVPCCLVYVAGCMWLLYKWFTEKPVISK